MAGQVPALSVITPASVKIAKGPVYARNVMAMVSVQSAPIGNVSLAMEKEFVRIVMVRENAPNVMHWGVALTVMGETLIVSNVTVLENVNIVKALEYVRPVRVTVTVLNVRWRYVAFAMAKIFATCVMVREAVVSVKGPALANGVRGNVNVLIVKAQAILSQSWLVFPVS